MKIKNSSLNILSIYYNLRKVLDKGCDEDMVDLYHIFDTDRLLQSNKFLILFAKIIYNEIENGYYTHDDMILLSIANRFDDKIVRIDKMEHKHIKTFRKWFCKKQLQKEMEFIKEIIKEANLKDFSELFEIRSPGQPIIYKLMKEQLISPMFYLYILLKKPLTLRENDAIFDTQEYDDYQAFKWKAKYFIKTYKEMQK